MSVQHCDLSSNVLKCGEPNCFRHFNTRNPFQKHLLNTHGVPLIHDKENNFDYNQNSAIANEDIYFDEELSQIPTENGSEHISIQEFREGLNANAVEIMTKIYAKRRLPLKAAQSLVDDFQKFLGGGHLSILKAKVKNALSKPQCASEEIQEIVTMFEMMENPFDTLNTEYKRLKYLCDKGYYFEPQSYIIDRSFAAVNTKEGLRGKMINISGQFIPPRWTLKKFFELPDALPATLRYMASLPIGSSVLRNLVQCPHYLHKRSRYKKDDIVLPICASCDDVNVNNPLGGHVGKVAAMYISIPCLPPEVSSQLDNHFLVLIYESWMRKDKLREAYQPIIDEFTYLETNGIEIDTIDGPKKVYFILTLLQGDNLGLHGMLGLVESFSANHYCRFCKMEKSQCQESVHIPRELLRTVMDYEADCLLKNRVSAAGIKEPSPFNDIPSFHAMENPVVDEMHDFREGIANFDMIDILQNLTNGPYKAFDLDVLNERLRTFDFGPIDGRNKPQLIRDADLTEHKKLRMTASEMTRLVLRLGVIMGDMVRDEDNPYWKFYLQLRELFDFTLAKKITKDDITAFRSSIVKHHKTCRAWCNRPYKPKEHFGLHVGDVAEKIGPIVHVSSMRHESKHTHMTAPAPASLSRVNIAYSLAKREQLAFASKLLKNESILPSIKTSTKMNILRAEQLNCCLPRMLQKYAVFKSPKWVEFKGTVFEPKMALITGTKDLSPIFAEIEKIVMHDELETPFFLCSCLDNLGFDQHKWAFEIVKTDGKICVSTTDLYDPLPVTIHTASKGELYIGLRYAV